MNLNTAQTAERDDRLGDILAAWLESVEAGQTPDRAAWLARHPEFASELTEFFTDHEELQAVAAPLRDVARAGATPAPHTPSLAPDAGSFGDYELLEVLGQGGMGIVYKAKQKSLSRLVALKMIRADRLASPEQVRRIGNEAEAVAALDHPNVVPIYEVGECAGQPFFTMKLLEGGSLAGGVANGVAPRAAAHLLAQVALAVHHAHQRGILHRDLKPSNILLDAEGRPHVADFGLAKWLTGDSSLTGTGAVVGTPSYAAPEQASANPRQLTTAADVYGLGAILYALLTGRPPFQGETPLHTLDLLRQEEPIAPRRLNRAIPADLETIVAKAMDKNPEARYATAREMAEDLERFLRDEPIWARRPSLTRRLTGWCRRHPSVTWSAVVALILVAVGSGVAAIFFQRQEIKQRELAKDADTHRRSAERNAAEAQHQTAKTLEAKEEAERQRNAVYQNLYHADMRLGLADWNGGNLSRLSDKLRSHVPRTGANDVRGWEWYHLLSLCHQDERTLTDHAGQVNAVAWSPDGRYLASASKGDRTTKVWDTTSWRLLRTFGPGLSGVSWSPDSQRLAWGSYDGRVFVWHVPTGEVQVLRGHTGCLWSVAWSPNGKQLASVSFDQSIRVWEPATGSCIRVWKASESIRSLAWHPDGKTLASAGYDEVRIWDTVSGKILREDIYTGQAYSVAWSPDGNQLALGTGGQCRLYNTADWSEAAQWAAHTDLVRCVAWNAGGSRLASGGNDGLIKVWDPERAACVLTLRGHLNQVTSVAWEPGGRRLASAGTDGNVKIWALPPVLQPRRLEGRTGGHRALCWAEEGDTLRSLDATKGLITLWNVATGQSLSQTPVARGQSGWFSAGGRLVAVADEKASRLQVCDARSGKLVQIVNAKADGFSSFSPDASQLMLRSGNAVHVVNLGQNEIRFRWDVTSPQAGSWSPDGRLLAIAGNGGPAEGDQTWANWVHVFDIDKGQRILKLRHKELGEGAVAQAVTWSPNGKQLVSGDNSGLTVVWEISSGHLVAEAKLHTAGIRTLAWSPDGRRVASGSGDRTVRIWDPRNGEELLRFDVPNAVVTKLHWSSDGRRLAASCTDGSIQIWDASAGYDYAHSAAYALEPVHASRRQAQELWAQQRREDAIGLLERTVELCKTEVGLDHSNTLQSMDELADAYGQMGRWQEAIALDAQTLEKRRAKLGPDHIDTVRSMQNLGYAYWRAGRLKAYLCA